MGRCMGQGCCSVDFILEPPEPARGDEYPQGPAHKTQRCIDHAFSRLHILVLPFGRLEGKKKKKKANSLLEAPVHSRKEPKGLLPLDRHTAQNKGLRQSQG